MKKTLMLMRQIAPPAPPCFADRMTWVEYLASTHVARKATKIFDQVPMLIQVAGQPRINREWSYCSDCTAQHSHRMRGQGRCQPDFLRSREAADV